MSETSEDGEKKTKFNSEEDPLIVCEDRLSSLSDSIIADEILSPLPIQSAVKTSVLSRRWRHLWTQVSRLHFSFLRFTTVDHILRQLTSPKIKSFHLRFNNRFNHSNDKEQIFSYVDAWFRRICSLNPEIIEVGYFGNWAKFQLPSCIFECQSLVSLNLSIAGLFDYSLPHNGIVSLPKLEKLYISLFDSDLHLMEMILKSSPLLEELNLEMFFVANGNLSFMDISSQNLKQLRLDITGGSVHNKFVINAPNLEHITLDKRGSASRVHFMSIPSALIKANLGLIDPKKDDVDHLGGSLELLLRGISATRSLDVNASLFCPLNDDLDDRVWPIFQNLTFLTLRLNDSRVFGNFLDIIHNTPTLKDLIISKECGVFPRTKWGVSDSVPACLSSKLESIKILGLEGTDEELLFLKYILSNANVLEWLHVWISFYRYQEYEFGEELELYKKLFRYPRSSSACEIIFTGKYLGASSRNFKHKSLDC